MEFVLPNLTAISDVREELDAGGAYRIILWDNRPSWAIVVRDSKGGETVVVSSIGGSAKTKVRTLRSIESLVSSYRRIEPDGSDLPQIPIYPDAEFAYPAERRAMLDAYCAERDDKIRKRYAIRQSEE